LGGPQFHFVAGDLNKTVLDIDGLVAEFAPDIVIVDAAYLLDPGNVGGKFARYAKHEALQEVLKGLKDMALKRDIPVNISVQFNRDAKKGTGTSGIGLENIFGSDWIGQMASNVVGISHGEGQAAKTQRIYHVLKVRNGADGGKFSTNFLFEPFDMNFIMELADQAANNNTAVAQQVASMI
jgi:hypothetical protein